MERFIGGERWDKEVKRVYYSRQGHILFGKNVGSYLGDYLTRVDKEVSD